MVPAIPSVLLSLMVAAGAVIASPFRIRSPYALKDSHFVPDQWSKVGTAPENHRIQLSIGLKQSQFHELERYLYEGMLWKIILKLN
jgi:tripeptidyl-peptidase I